MWENKKSKEVAKRCESRESDGAPPFLTLICRELIEFQHEQASTNMTI